MRRCGLFSVWCWAVLGASADWASGADRISTRTEMSRQASQQSDERCPTTVQKHGWDLRSSHTPCPVKSKAGSSAASDPVSKDGAAARLRRDRAPEAGADGFSLFNLPWHGFALKAGAHLTIGGGFLDGARAGGSVELGLSYYFGRQVELGVILPATWLWGEEWDLFGDGNPREFREFLVVPRALLSVGANKEAFWRLHASAGLGPAWTRAKSGDLPRTEERVPAAVMAAGFSAGTFQLELQIIRYTKHDSNVVLVPAPGEGEPVYPRYRGSGGLMVSIGFVLPIPLTSIEPGEPAEQRPDAPQSDVQRRPGPPK